MRKAPCGCYVQESERSLSDRKADTRFTGIQFEGRDIVFCDKAFALWEEFEGDVGAENYSQMWDHVEAAIFASIIGENPQC